MYIENNRRAAENRADADFLRRMLGGELNGNGCDGNRSCNRPFVESRQEMGACCEWTPQARRQPQARQEEAPPMRPENGCGCQKPCNTSCPTEIHAPALAMVYSPYQKFDSLYDPRQGLCNGTIFGELNKPFHGDGRGC